LGASIILSRVAAKNPAPPSGASLFAFGLQRFPVRLMSVIPAFAGIQPILTGSGPRPPPGWRQSKRNSLYGDKLLAQEAESAKRGSQRTDRPGPRRRLELL